MESQRLLPENLKGITCHLVEELLDGSDKIEKRLY